MASKLMKCLIGLLTMLLAAVALMNCAKASPVDRMQRIAQNAKEHGDKWTEQKWQQQCDDYLLALHELVKQQPDTDVMFKAVVPTIDFVNSATAFADKHPDFKQPLADFYAKAEASLESLAPADSRINGIERQSPSITK